MAKRQLRVLILGLGMSLLTLPTAWGDFQDGNQLLQNCAKEKDIQAQAYCVGYVAAVADVLGMGDGDIAGWRACLPSSATQGDVVEVAIDWLKKHASIRNAGASDIVAHALAETYPCTP